MRSKMADSMTDNPETAIDQQETFLYSLPTEILVKFIFKHSSLLSLIQLSATCRYFRFLIHGIFTSRLSCQASNHPEIREGLARLGWTKDHKLWSCNCFKIVGGPAVTWGQLEQKKRFSGVFNPLSGRLSFPIISTTVAGKTFLIVSSNTITYWENASDSAMESTTLISFNSACIGYLSSYDNVMAFSVSTDASRCISVYNPSTLARVTDIDLLASGNHSGGEEIRSAVVQAITFAKNTMLVRLFYATVNIPYETNIQLWKIDTKNPLEEGISIISSISHRNTPISRFLPNLHFQVNQVHFNDRYVVVWDEGQVKVLSRNKDPELICQFGLDGRNPMNISLLKSLGDLIALSFWSYNDDNVPELMVKVYSASRGVLILQKNLNEGSCPELRYMEWIGPHLIVVLQKGNALTMMSWQEGLESFMTCPVSVPGLRRSPRGNGERASNWDLHCFNVDYRSITSAYEKNLQNGWSSHPITYFQTWDSNC